MSWTDPARVERLEALLYQCLSTFSAMLEHPTELVDQRHVQHAHDKLESKMKDLDLPDYNTWKWSAGKGHEEFVCIVDTEESQFLNIQRWYVCGHCGTSFALWQYTEDGDEFEITPSSCPHCGRKVMSIA